MDGYETTRAIRRMPQYARLPVITVTARAMQGDREKSIDAGATDYITKPIDIEELLNCMERWLGPAQINSRMRWNGGPGRP
jgi:CheY-like chemotaxis protein